MSDSRHAFHISSSQESERIRIVLSGVMDEHSDLSPITAAISLAGPSEITIDLRAVRRINSVGVRLWIATIREIPRAVRLLFVHCPPPFIDQCNRISSFLGHGVIESFYAPLICDPCDKQTQSLFDVADCHARASKLPPVKCLSCQRDMELDDLEETYLLFLHKPSS